MEALTPTQGVPRPFSSARPPTRQGVLRKTVPLALRRSSERVRDSCGRPSSSRSKQRVKRPVRLTKEEERLMLNRMDFLRNRMTFSFFLAIVINVWLATKTLPQ